MLADIETEMRLLGTCFKSVDCVNQTLSALHVLHFDSPKNREIWLKIKFLYENDSEVRLETIEPIIDLKTCPLAYLLDVYAVGSLGISIPDCIKALKEFHIKRELDALAKDLQKNLLNKKINSSECIRVCEEKLFLLSQDSSKKVVKNIPQSVDEPKDFLVELQDRQDRFKQGVRTYEGIPTYFTKLDEYLKGLCPGHLTLVGARPGMGKTTFALNLAVRVVKQCNESILFFSLEMPGKELGEKIICLDSRVSFQKFKEGSLNSCEFQNTVVSYNFWKDKNFLIDEQPALDIEQLMSRATRYKKTHNIAAIFIDYVQLLHSKSQEIRHLEIGDISRKLKELAKKLHVPVIALAQLNREVEKRTDKKPYLADLRESGSLEADADEVILLHRKEVYDPFDKPGLMQVYIPKNRFGPQGDFELFFEKETGRLENYVFENVRPQNLPNSVLNGRNKCDDFIESLQR